MTKSSKILKKNSKKKSLTNESTAIELARRLVGVIDEKKGYQITVFDLRDTSPITDVFVIANGLSEIHTQTIAESLAHYIKPVHIEGYETGTWILLDYVDVIVHIFTDDTRQFYGLERLWGDVQQIIVDHD